MVVARVESVLWERKHLPATPVGLLIGGGLLALSSLFDTPAILASEPTPNRYGEPASLTRLEAVRLHIPRREINGWRGHDTQAFQALAWNFTARFRGRAA